MKKLNSCRNIGFISFRFATTDGVSLEVAKWAEVLEELGHTCFYFSGISDRPEERSMVVPEAHFRHPEVLEYHDKFFSQTVRKESETKWIHHHREIFKKKLKEFIKKFDLDILVPQNLLSFPLNIPLSLALTEIIAETNFPVIAHHHDFTWERKNLIVNSVWDYISMALPPSLPSVQHVVINSSARHHLARRRGLGSKIIPNVMDFENPPAKPDEYTRDLKKDLGVAADELLILQPTRIVRRKGIEHAIELVNRLGKKAKLVISHAAGDAGFEYEDRVRQYAKLMKVNTLFSSDIIQEHRGTTKDGRKVYSLGDIYPYADLVTYPSVIEGFGNAFLEAIYFRRPIVVNNYTIFALDIHPKGFKVIEFNDYIMDDTVKLTREVLDNPELAKDMCETNYRLALRHYSYKIIKQKLKMLIENVFGSS